MIESNRIDVLKVFRKLISSADFTKIYMKFLYKLDIYF